MSTHTILVHDDIDLAEIPRRDYDFSRGDTRWSTQEKALEVAEAKALETGIRQTVRRSSSPHFTELWLVQAVGS